MLDMGFAEVMANITQRLPKDRQTILMSATFPDDIKRISRSIQRNPVQVTIDDQLTHDDDVLEQLFFEIGKHERETALLFSSTIVQGMRWFFAIQKQCSDVAGFLCEHDIEAIALHGDLDQRERDQVLLQFANGSCPVLVASDVAARDWIFPRLRWL